VSRALPRRGAVSQALFDGGRSADWRWPALPLASPSARLCSHPLPAPITTTHQRPPLSQRGAYALGGWRAPGGNGGDPLYFEARQDRFASVAPFDQGQCQGRGIGAGGPDRISKAVKGLRLAFIWAIFECRFSSTAAPQPDTAFRAFPPMIAPRTGTSMNRRRV
jgi:hypothetical protein